MARNITETFPASSVMPASAIVELRQYTLHPGMGDTLIDLFERVFIAEQEAHGIAVIDQFRDLDEPNRFVWLRGFPDMPRRGSASAAFYDGAVWRRHRDAANATMIDSDDVLLLRPVGGTAGYPTAGDRPAVGAAPGAEPVVVATTYHLGATQEADFPSFFTRAVAPALTEAGATVLATYVTDHSPNNYPRLPIREEARVLVWFARFPDAAAVSRHRTALAQSPRWRAEIGPALARRIVGAPQVMRLAPTARSRTRA